MLPRVGGDVGVGRGRVSPRHIQCLLFSKLIPDRTAPKPNKGTPADDYQSKRVRVRLSEIKIDQKPSSDKDHRDPRREKIQ
jgi:hypothetical protein